MAITLPPALAWSRRPHDDVWAWFVRLRWGASLGQFAAIAAVHWLFLVPVAIKPLLALVTLGALTNVPLHWRQRRAPTLGYGTMTLVLVADVAVVTGLLLLSGGPTNPFANIYTVHVALAATMLPGAGVLVVMASTFVGFASLFVWHEPVAMLQQIGFTPLYLRGLTAAFGAAVLFIAYFVGRIQLALARSEARLAQARERAVRDEKLSSLATLAAGAAHELATPLGTIAVAAKEMQRNLAAMDDASSVLEDAHLIRREVERCRQVLQHMAHDAGACAAEGFVALTPQALVHNALGELQAQQGVAISFDNALRGQLCLPEQTVAHSLRAVVRNALDASAAAPTPADGHKVLVRIYARAGACCIDVSDVGCGMAQDVLARAGEPFFTTKGPGRGMGLGLFLARTVFERLGGGLHVDSHLGTGTTVALTLPLMPPLAAQEAT